MTPWEKYDNICAPYLVLIYCRTSPMASSLMRTDSVRISDDAMGEVRQYISTKYGAHILPETPNIYKVKKSAQAQEAHEAVRPTSLEYDPEQIKDFLTR